ncbi:IclR family transcriptional regulator [Pedobacter hiemivivus]|uniref:IclR family transcriptional regulator n=1 Tax=Pedobacter hiemivivus TaxID=2530454 RepID=A0A4R0NG16_9SPHI|nr:IclR family transcriptional regulator [Pedobacter hiemivivus]TCC99345.1 IclR family transcriptional regulator [Pedobacter hiemivivus]TKC63807.1 IclR family transcriptional regulator [Pedobacter hiemivivus]
MKEKEIKYQAPALDKGLDILEYLSAQSIPLSQTEIATGIDKSPNEIYRMLMSLESRGYILRDEVSGKYRLSLKLFYLSHRHSPVDELRKAAQYPLEELANAVMQSCHLSILYMNQVMVIIHAKSPGPIALSIEEGNLFPLPLTASGKVLLAYMPETEQEIILSGNEIYQTYADKDKKKFLNSLQGIQNKGAYIRTSDLAAGVVDVSVPIGRGSTGIIACLTVSSLTALNVNKDMDNEDILAEAIKCAKKIEERIGVLTL